MTLDQPSPAWRADGVETPGAYIARQAKLGLRFDEPNSIAMTHFVERRFEIVESTRFVISRAMWTGKGVQSPPKIEARTISGTELLPRKYGPFFPDGRFTAYLIDLGASIAAGEQVFVRTETKYVDESNSFKPFFSSNAQAGLEQLDLVVEFVVNPTVMRYLHYPEGSSSEVTGEVVDGDLRFSVNLSPPALGRHVLEWVF